MSRQAEDLLEGVRILLRTFTVDETRYPPAQGRIKYNAIDFQALHFIGHNPGCGGAALAEFLGVAPTTAQSVCDRLIRRGFAVRMKSETSGRAVEYKLTKEGQSVASAIRQQDLANCEAMLSALPATQRERFVSQVLLIAERLS